MMDSLNVNLGNSGMKATISPHLVGCVPLRPLVTLITKIELVGVVNLVTGRETLK
jgi:hypothetical protein